MNKKHLSCIIKVAIITFFSFAPLNIAHAATQDSISPDNALHIAMQQTGIAENAFDYSHVEDTVISGDTVYSVKLVISQKEYNYKINGLTGQIIESSIDTQ